MRTTRSTRSRLTAAVEAVEPRRMFAYGDVDTTFGSGGTVVVDANANDYPRPAVAVQPDGRIVVATSSAVKRYLANGAPDPTFVSTFNPGRVDSVAVEPDGKILIGGSDLAQLNADGSLDTSFAGGLGYIMGVGSAAAIQSTGKIVVEGSGQSLLARYDADGTVDSTFNGSAAALPTDPTASQNYGSVAEIAVDPQDRIVVSYYTSAYFSGQPDDDYETVGVLRTLPDGTPDTSFGSNGAARSNTQGSPDNYYYVSAENVTTGPSGVIYQLSEFENGHDGEYQVLDAYSADGKTTAEGDTVGKVATDSGGLALTTDGRPVVVGEQLLSSYLPLNTSNGSSLAADPSLGGTGQVMLTLPSQTAFPYFDATAVTTAPDGSLVVAGVDDINSPGFQVYPTGQGVGRILKLQGDSAVAASVGSVSGTVFFDANANGRQDANDSALAKQSVFLDNNNDGVFDAGDVLVYSDATGAYSFQGLKPGTYHVVQTPPSGLGESVSGGAYTINVSAGSMTTGVSFGLAALPKLTGTPVGTAGSYLNQGNTIAKAFDGNLSTYFDGPTNSGDVVGLDLGSVNTIKAIAYAPRSGWASRMVGGVFQGANSAVFSGATTLYTITTAPAVGVYTTVAPLASGPFRYVRYVAPGGSFGDVAEIGFEGPLVIAKTPITGAIGGTAGSYQNDGNTVAKAFDGNLNTYFDGPTANGNVITEDFGTAYTIGSIQFAPRGGYAGRMVGGTFQGSNSSNFSSATTLYTITTAPQTGALTVVTPTSAGPFRYVRYVAPAGSYGNVAEIAYFGAPSSKLAGAYIGTPGSYKNTGNTIANVFDGNLSSYFDGPDASGDWVGLDVGPDTFVSQVRFAPRPGLEFRMKGGVFQASDSPTFSTGVVTLATITTTPPSGTLTTVTFAAPVARRYYRYLGPAGAYCNIAELEFDE